MLNIPNHLDALKLGSTPVDFHADWSIIDQLYQVDSPYVESHIRSTTARFKLGFAAAAIEWIAWRLDGIVEIKEPLDYAEALWAAAIDFRLFNYLEWSRPDSNPVRYVLYCAWEEASAVLRGSQKKGNRNTEDCLRLALLARHVLSKDQKDVFAEWLRCVLGERLIKYWQIDPMEKDPDICLGKFVPREAFDHSFEFSLSDSENLAKSYIENLDFDSNSFLIPSVEVKRLGLSKHKRK